MPPAVDEDSGGTHHVSHTEKRRREEKGKRGLETLAVGILNSARKPHMATAAYALKFQGAVASLQDVTNAHVCEVEGLGARHLEWLQTSLADVWMGITGEKPVVPAREAGGQSAPTAAAATPGPRGAAASSALAPLAPFSLTEGGGDDDAADGSVAEDRENPRRARLSTVGIAGSGHRGAAPTLGEAGDSTSVDLAPPAAPVAPAASSEDTVAAPPKAGVEEAGTEASGRSRRGGARPPLAQKPGERRGQCSGASSPPTHTSTHPSASLCLCLYLL
jgi:hypothetical protein